VISKEDLLAQVERDRLAFEALPESEQKRLTREVELLRRPTHTNYSDPEAL